MVKSSRMGRTHLRLRRVARVFSWALLLGAISSTLGSCDAPDFLQDPLERAKVAALGPEDPAIPVGPLHRAGQPCAVCHRVDGLASPHTASGTVYRDPLDRIAVADVAVTLRDASGRTFTTKTNCAGSFYVKDTEFGPTSPFWVSIQLGEFPWEMSSPIHREASCAACHLDPAGPTSAGHVFLTNDDTMFATIPLRPCTAQDGVSR
jgi:hypothetical protein